MRFLLPAVLLALVSAIARAEPPARIDPGSLDQKALMGYQGWFSCPGDGTEIRGWHHWLRGGRPLVEMWPDTREFDPDELYDSPWKLPDGSPARLFSSANPKTVLRHFQWMKAAGIDGILLQRFIGEVRDPRFAAFRNRVTRHAMAGAEATGRVFAIEYDMAASQSADVMADWKSLVDGLGVTRSPQYLQHRGKPVLCLWGPGFTHREGEAAEAQKLIDWLKTGAPERYRATVVGGVPAHWRTGTGDAKSGAEWAAVFRSYDVISPWTVGRFADDAGAERYLRECVIPDIEETRRLGIGYLPVVFPGFAWHNLHQGPFNQIPRRGGKFYWAQVANSVSAGASMLKIAMFDEVDEGTAMFKTAPDATFAPAGIQTLTLDADGAKLPPDWYLRLAGETSRLLRHEIPLSRELPLR